MIKYPSTRDISPSNIVHFGGRGLLLDFHAAKFTDPGLADRSTSPSYRATGKLAYMAIGLHYDGGRQSCVTDLESLFYCLLDAVSSGRSLRWRYLIDPALIRACKYSVVHDDREWSAALKHCQIKPLIPLLEGVREVVKQQNPSISMYLTAFGVN